MKMWRPLPVKTNLGYDNPSYNNQTYELIFRDLREAGVSVKPVDSVSVLWRAGRPFLSLPLNSGPGNYYQFFCDLPVRVL
jgi:hypothetical protein